MIGTSRIASSTVASADATGQSLLEKNSVHSVCPMNSESRAAEQIGDDEFADDRE